MTSNQRSERSEGTSLPEGLYPRKYFLIDYDNAAKARHLVQEICEWRGEEPCSFSSYSVGGTELMLVISLDTKRGEDLLRSTLTILEFEFMEDIQPQVQQDLVGRSLMPMSTDPYPYR